MPKENIRICRDTVIKTGPPDSIRVEVEKAVRGFEIGQDCGLFSVPKILDYDQSKGQVVFERLHNIWSIREVIELRRKYDSLAETIGHSLAIIHNKLTLPKDMITPLPPDFSLPAAEVFLHGDFSIDNICVGSSCPPIIVLDWQMTKVHGGNTTYGTRYFDLAWFVNNLFSRMFHRYLFSAPVAPIARKFLSSYFETAEFVYNAEEFISYMKRFYGTKLALRRKNLTWKRRSLLTPGHIFWGRFIESLHLQH